MLPQPPAPGPDGLRSLEDHRDYLLGCVERAAPFGQHVLDALDLSICEDIVSADRPARLRQLRHGRLRGARRRTWRYASRTAARSGCRSSARSPPAEAAPHRLSPGTAMKIMTGAPIPADADAIVPYEATDRGCHRRQVYRAQRPSVSTSAGLGEDVAAGTRSSAVGDQLGSATSGCWPPSGSDKVHGPTAPAGGGDLHRLRAGRPGLALATEQQIYDSNSYLLAAAAKAAGAQVFRVGHGRRRPGALKRADRRSAVRGRPHPHHRWRQPGRLRHRQGGDARARRHRLRPRSPCSRASRRASA